MTGYYDDTITQQSEQLLRDLRTLVPEAVVLGGWATFLYGGGQRSKDVDIAVQPNELTRLQQHFGGALRKNNNLRKYEVKLANGVELDVFVAFFSNSGVPIEELMPCTRRLGGHRVICPEGLLVLKLCAWIDRAGRPKGDKDEMDVLTVLASTTLDWTRYRSYVALAQSSYRARLHGAIVRLCTSADRRENWKRVLRGGAPAYPNEHAWRREVERLRGIVPSGS